MGKLIATTQATVDGVVDPVAEWVQPDGDHGDYSFERQARSSGLVLGRKTYEGLAGYWPSQSGKWADMVNAMAKYVGSNTLSETSSGTRPCSRGTSKLDLEAEGRGRR
jgi:dihydrofolate reductase